jgi:bifunctional enzyme CysN/CysC
MEMAPAQRAREGGATKDLLRFITCGSVDDGKSTLIGRLLHDSKLIFEDQLSALRLDSKRYGSAGQEIDFALLLDGLEAEREQGITIDVAYRFFATARRAFVVADAPGHEHYTRNMATGASNAQAAVILIDVRKGVLAQTRRHSLICSLFGVRQVVWSRSTRSTSWTIATMWSSASPMIIARSRRHSASLQSCRFRSRHATATM